MKMDVNMWLCFYAGVIVSTPTGSTAYAAAAGASMIHPNVPAIMVTPICPHSLSFRPIVVPAGVELMVRGTFCQGLAIWMTTFTKQTCVFFLFYFRASKERSYLTTNWIYSADNAIAWRSQHSLGLIWWQKEAGNPAWWQVTLVYTIP